MSSAWFTRCLGLGHTHSGLLLTRVRVHVSQYFKLSVFSENPGFVQLPFSPFASLSEFDELPELEFEFEPLFSLFWLPF